MDYGKSYWAGAKADTVVMFKRRPLFVTPFSIWLKPGLKIKCTDILFHLEHETDEQGRIRLQLVDEMDRAYWVRLTPKQYRIFSLFGH